jgi:hypothetical protein
VAEQIPSARGISGPAALWTHDWYPYENYLNVHESYVERLISNGSILRRGLSFVESYASDNLVAVNVVGTLVCAEDVLIKVDKWLAVRRNRRRRYEVKGSDYVYHARSGRRGINLIRYCSAHGMDDLHCHLFDLRTGNETGRPNIGLNDLPTLGDFIPQAIALGREAALLGPAQ